MTKKSDNTRCTRPYQKKDGTWTYHAEVRRKRAKPLRKRCQTLTEAKNWVRSTESAILEGRVPQEAKARKYTINVIFSTRIYGHGGFYQLIQKNDMVAIAASWSVFLFEALFFTVLLFPPQYAGLFLIIGASFL